MLLPRIVPGYLWVLIGFGAFFWRAPAHSTFPDFRYKAPAADAASSEPVFGSEMIPNVRTRHVHAASHIELPDGRIMAFWYGGEREGAKDVAIYQAAFDPQSKQWSTPIAVVTREQTQAAYQVYVKKIGNAVATIDSANTLWLFYVTTAIGGWATSSINVMTSEDLGLSWSNPTRLMAAPLFNISHLVKGNPIELADGTIGLPAYHQAGGKFSEWLHIGKDKQVINKSRITSGTYAIQPSIVVLSERQAVAFMRDSGEVSKRVHVSVTNDGAKTWLPSQNLSIKNPNAAVAVQKLSKNELILVFNDDEEERHNLTLAYSGDQGKNWRNIATLENEQGLVPAEAEEREYSYPYLIRTKNNTFHLLYTWHTTHIKHLYFNQAWLRQHTI